MKKEVKRLSHKPLHKALYERAEVETISLQDPSITNIPGTYGFMINDGEMEVMFKKEDGIYEFEISATPEYQETAEFIRNYYTSRYSNVVEKVDASEAQEDSTEDAEEEEPALNSQPAPKRREKSREKVLNTIKNLLELADGTNNENEMQNALAQAQKLMAKHGIEAHEAQEAKDATEIEVDETVVDDVNCKLDYQLRLADIIAKHFKCKVFYRVKKWKTSQFTYDREVRPVFVGTKEDAQLATMLMVQSFAFMERRKKAYRRSMRKQHGASHSGVNQGYTASWAHGFVQGLDENLKEMAAALVQEDTKYEVALSVPREVEDYYNNLDLSNSNVGKNSAHWDSGSYAAGVQDGRAFNKEVE